MRLSSAARLRVFLLNMPTVYPHRREGHGRARSSLGPGFMAICQSRLDRRRSAGPAPVLRRHTIALGPLRNAAWGSRSGRAVHSSPSWPSPRRCAPQLSRGRERDHDRAAAAVFRAMFSDLGRYDPCNRSGSRTPRSKGSPSPSPRRQTARASHREWRIAVGCMVRIVLPTSESADAAGDTPGAGTAIARKGIGP